MSRHSTPYLSNSALKATLLGSLYLLQSAPKGYLKYLPIILREKKTSLKQLSSLSLLYLPELLKPIFSIFLDTDLFMKVKNKKRLLITIHALVITLFSSASILDYSNIWQLGILFFVTNLLMAIHDATVDGLAVQILLPSEQPFGAFGQYAGYKTADFLTGGLMATFLGDDHRSFCLGILTIVVSASLFTISCDTTALTSHLHSSTTQNTTIGSTVTCLTPVRVDKSVSRNRAFGSKAHPDFSPLASMIQLCKRNLQSLSGLALILVLLLYKAGEHGLDFVWTLMLVDAGIKRKEILRTQFLLGNVAALAGAWVGSVVTSRSRSAAHALALVSALRLIPESMQYIFAVSSIASVKSVSYVAVHSILENIAGSALTSCMFSFLLANADPLLPTTSYALMTTFATIGMRFGEYFSGLGSAYYGYKNICGLALFMNAIFPILVRLLKKQKLLF